MLLGLSSGKLYEGVCPNYTRTYDQLPGTIDGLSVTYYLPAVSKINHLFYPTNEDIFIRLMIIVQFYDDGGFHLYKRFSDKEICYVEIVSWNFTEGYFDNHRIISKSIETFAGACGKEWDMYQMFQYKEYLLLWGCVNLGPTGPNEQGAWLLTNQTSGFPVELFNMLNFSPIKIYEFIIAKPQTNVSKNWGVNKCGNQCKYAVQDISEIKYLILVTIAILLLMGTYKMAKSMLL